MRAVIFFAMALAMTATLTACGGNAVAEGVVSTTAMANSDASLKNQAHTAREYYNDKQLRAKTLDACSVSNDAEYDANMALPACKFAMAAEMDHELGKGAPL